MPDRSKRMSPRRRRLLGLVATMTTGAGCAGLNDSTDSAGTVAPELRGTPTSSVEFQAEITVDGRPLLHQRAAGLVVAVEHESNVQLQVYHPSTLSERGSVSVPASQSTIRLLDRSVVVTDSGRTHVYSLSDGTERWATDGRYFRHQYDGDGLVLGVDSDTDIVVRVDTETWTEQWRLGAVPSERPELTNAELTDVGDGYALFQTAEPDPQLRCYDVTTGSVRWERPLPEGYQYPTPIRVGDTLAFPQLRRVETVDFDTGRHLRTYEPVAPINSSWVTTNDRTVFFGGELPGNGTGILGVVALDTRTGREWRLSEGIRAAQPIVARDTLVVTADTDRGTVALGVDPATGAVRWRRPGGVVAVDTEDAPFDTAYVADGTRLTAVEPDGTVRWQKPVPLVEPPAPGVGELVADGKLLTVPADRTDRTLTLWDGSGVVTYDTSDGTVLARLAGLSEVSSVVTTVVSDTPRLFVGTDGRIGLVEL